MNDLISRQAALDAINELHDKPNAWLDLAVDTLEKLPSVQPEIIRCKDCKHLYQDDGCPLRTWRTHTEDDFCSYAEGGKNE